MAEVFFFFAAIGAVGGAVGTVVLRDAFYSVLALVCHLIFLAMLFLLLRAEFVAAAQVIVYAGAVMVLYVFVVGYVGGMEAGLARPRRAGAARSVSVLFAFALFVELTIALVGTGLEALSTEGAPYEAGFGEPGDGRRAVPDRLPRGVRGRLAAAADRRRRRGHPRPPPLRAGRRARDLGRRGDAHAADQGRGARGHDDRGRRPGEHLMAIIWYLIVSALIFCIGAGGVLTRRNPLVILLCLELMLNAANLALVAFARAHGDMGGQIFALMVMVVAACEVAVGLGLVVALYRRRLPIDVDELRELQG